MTTTDWKNQLYFGDNLESSATTSPTSVDLIYPPTEFRVRQADDSSL